MRMKRMIVCLCVVLLLIAPLPALAENEAVDLSSFQRVGNLTGGYGLVALVDNNQTTNCYAQQNEGWGGVVFSTPRSIYEAQIDSQTNGFDASGLTSSILIQLYGKTSGTPAYSTDGTLLGQQSFTDVNQLTTKTIVPSNTETEFSAIWFRIISTGTGMWAASTGIRLYTGESVSEPAEEISGRTILTKSVNEITPLMWSASEVDGFRIRIHLSDAAVAKVLFHADCVHRGDITNYTGAVGVGLRVGYRYSETLAGLSGASIIYPENLVGGFNISEQNPQHYGNTTIHDAIQLAAGYYEFTVTGSAHSSGSQLNGLAAILAEPYNAPDHGLNRLMIEIDPDVSLIAL